MTTRILALLAFACGTTLAAGAQTPAPSARPHPIVHHAVSSNAAAQAAFDRGLLDYYAYNPEAAEHEFYTAADLDPHLAMPIGASRSPTRRT